MRGTEQIGRVFASLQIPNYRRYFTGILVSNVGTWMGRTAVAWLVLVDLTHGNASALGWLTGLMFLPMLLIGPFAGALADQFPKRRIMMATQSVMALDSALLAVLTLSGQVQVWQVFAVVLLDGVAAAIDAPARQAFVSELVGRDGLANAISLNSASFNAARLLGPGLAGLMIAFSGTGTVFVINVASFAVFLFALGRLDSAALELAPVRPGRRSLLGGLAYVREHPHLILLLAIGFMMGNFGFNFALTNALMATEAFGRGPGEYGLLGSAMGGGALLASLSAARRSHPRLRYVLAALGGFCLFSLASAAAPDFVTFTVLMAPIGFCAITTVVTANTLIQVTLEPEVRGRVMSLWMVLLLGGSPLVSPILGWVGDAFGARACVSVGAVAVGLTCVSATWYVMASDHLRVRLDWASGRPHWHVLQVTEEVSPPEK